MSSDVIRSHVNAAHAVIGVDQLTIEPRLDRIVTANIQAQDLVTLRRNLRT